jgi:recombination protein RecR
LPDRLKKWCVSRNFADFYFLMIFSSKLIEDAVTEFAKLPGIGKKTALRMVLQLLRMEESKVDAFTNAVSRMRHEVKFCNVCHNVADGELCGLCANPGRNRTQVCVVENIRDVIAIESTQQYNGLYHVLGGVISPLDGIGPDQLQIESLKGRVLQEGVKELIMALSPNIEGDTTVFYISRMLKGSDVLITTIARGIAFGGDLEYADEITLAKSIAKRLPVDNYVNTR